MNSNTASQIIVRPCFHVCWSLCWRSVLLVTYVKASVKSKIELYLWRQTAVCGLQFSKKTNKQTNPMLWIPSGTTRPLRLWQLNTHLSDSHIPSSLESWRNLTIYEMTAQAQNCLKRTYHEKRTYGNWSKRLAGTHLSYGIISRTSLGIKLHKNSEMRQMITGALRICVVHRFQMASLTWPTHWTVGKNVDKPS